MEKEYQQEMKETWKAFVTGSMVNQSRIRPEILNSWNRCLNKVNPFQKKVPVILKGGEYKKIYDKNKEMLEISIPVMEFLNQFVKGSGFIIALADNQGYILKVIGDEDILNTVKNINFIPASNWDEQIIGTNAIGTCLVTDKPLQIYAYEHWCICVQVGVCSCAPIHDPDSGKLIGALDMTAADCKKVHPHTLGMVVAAVGSIEAQLAAKRNWMSSQLANEYKSLIMESISDGLLAIDNAGTINHINQKAIDLLNLYGNPMGENIFHLLKRRFGKLENYRDFFHILNSQEKIDGEFVTIFTESGVIKCTVNSRSLWEGGNTRGKIILIQEISKIKKLINRVVGNRARTFFPDIIGQNVKMLNCLELASKAAKTSSNILLVGETGTGKDLFAQAIHNSSSRANEPYIAINCAAIPKDLLGSELFGYSDGAFTGAKRGGNPGKFELADQGTIFLDEIGEMPLGMQTFLLRALEEKSIMRIGGKGTIPVDVRIIAATNKDLAKEVALGNFRSDLYYRLNVISIELPPLRERKEDIPLLIDHLVKKIAQTMGKVVTGISPEFFDTLLLYDFPGNVRELQNLIEKAICMTNENEDELSLRSLPFAISSLNKKQTLETNQNVDTRILNKYRLNAEREIIKSFMENHKVNKSQIAKELGIARSSLYRKLEKFNINVPFNQLKKRGNNFQG